MRFRGSLGTSKSARSIDLNDIGPMGPSGYQRVSGCIKGVSGDNMGIAWGLRGVSGYLSGVVSQMFKRFLWVSRVPRGSQGHFRGQQEVLGAFELVLYTAGGLQEVSEAF